MLSLRCLAGRTFSVETEKDVHKVNVRYVGVPLHVHYERRLTLTVSARQSSAVALTHLSPAVSRLPVFSARQHICSRARYVLSPVRLSVRLYVTLMDQSERLKLVL